MDQRRLVAALAACLSAACGAPAAMTMGGNDAGAGDGGNLAQKPSAAANTLLGGFSVNLVPALRENGVEKTPAYTGVIGKVYDGASPATVAWKVIEEGGGCQLLTPSVPFCAGGCGASAACAPGDTCVAYPSALHLGPVLVKGLIGGDFTMEEIAGSYQPSGPIPYPPVREGVPIEMTAPGGSLGALRLESRGIVPLELTRPVHPVAGQPLELGWNAPGQRDLARIELKIDLSHHGGTKGKIECNVPDTGALAIPASQVKTLMGLGISGFPTIVITRVATGTTATKLGLVTLRVASSLEREVEIDGLHSCTADEECPMGMTCQPDLKCK
jgi:hypothetical protein